MSDDHDKLAAGESDHNASGEETLRVLQDNETLANDDVFTVESLLASRNSSEYDRVFRRIATTDPGDIAGVPLYEFTRTNLAFSFSQNAAPPDAITHLVVLYRALEDVFEERDPAAVEVGDLDPTYQAVVVDVARANDLPVRGIDEGKRPTYWQGLVAGFLGLLLLVADQVFSLLWKPFVGGVESAPTVFIPLVNRFDSMQPVMDAYEGECRTVLPSATLTWLRDVRHRVPELATYDPSPLNYFTSPALLAWEIVSLVRFAWALTVEDAFRDQLRTLSRERLGVEFEETLGLVAANLYRTHLPAIPNLFVAERMLDVLDPGRVVVGSLGSRQQAVLVPARRRGLLTYHVPHTATTGYEVLPRPPTVHFVPGQVAVDHLESSEQAEDLSNLEPAGRPQLAALAYDRPDEFDPVAEPLQVVVATQPFDDDIRRTFVRDVLDAVADSGRDVRVVVKIHPNERASFYDDPLAGREWVDLATDDLQDHLLSADLVVTINSNVGLEAMVLGTPCVCVNEWSPMVRTRPYAEAGPVPVLTERAAITDFFADLDADGLADLRDAQHEYLDERFALEGSPERIAEYVWDAAHPAAE